MSTTYDGTARRRLPTTRAWLALGAAGIAVLTLVTLIAVACAGRSDTGPLATDSTPTPTASPAGENLPDAAAGGGPDGGGTGDGGPGSEEDGDTQDTGAVEPAAEDCVSFDPEDLTVAAQGNDWVMRSGSTNRAIFASQADAEDAVKVARNWTRMCFIGRGNDRPDRYRYITHYWQEPSGLPLGLAPSFDCVSYDPPNLGVGEHAGSWWLLDGPAELLPLHNQPDAERARIVASGHTQLCYIGRGNDRPDHDRYTMSYWRP